jgi:hypothetical protein
MIAVRRMYVYMVTLAALGALSLGLANLVRALLEAAVHTPSATSPAYLQDQLALWAATALVALPIWAVHWRWTQTLCASLDERSSALRRLFVYAALAGAVIAAWIALDEVLSAFLKAVIANRLELARMALPPLPLIAVAGAVWAYYWRVATQDRLAADEIGASATLRRWYTFGFAAFAFLVLLDGAQTVVMTTWMRLTTPGSGYPLGVAGLTNTLIGLLVWSMHWAWLPTRLDAQQRAADQRATLRSVYLFLALAVVLVGTLSGVSQALYYGLARLLGISTPGGVGGSLVQAAAGPASVAIVYGAGWMYQRRVIARFGSELDTPRQIGVRRIYQYLTGLVALTVLSVGLSGLLWMLGDALARTPGAVTGDWWRDRLSLFATLTLVGLPVWLLHWQPRAEAEAGSLARRIYLYVSLIGAVLALLGSGAASMYRLLSLLLGSANADSALVDLSHAAAIAVVAAGLTAYQWRIVRADMRVSSPEPAPERAHVLVELSAPSARVLELALQMLGDRGITVKRLPA